jgi:hypothetical protein
VSGSSLARVCMDRRSGCQPCIIENEAVDGVVSPIELLTDGRIDEPTRRRSLRICALDNPSNFRP